MPEFDDIEANELAKAILEIFAERQGTASTSVDVDVEEHFRTTNKPGGGKVPEHFDVGNFSHQYAEQLVPKLPRGLAKEVEVTLPDGSKKRLDRVDWKNGVIYEVKPDTPGQKRIGEKQADVYVDLMNKEHPYRNPKTNKLQSWKRKVLLYDKKAVIRLLKSIGWIKAKPSQAAKASAKSKESARKVFVQDRGTSEGKPTADQRATLSGAPEGDLTKPAVGGGKEESTGRLGPRIKGGIQKGLGGANVVVSGAQVVILADEFLNIINHRGDQVELTGMDPSDYEVGTEFKDVYLGVRQYGSQYNIPTDIYGTIRVERNIIGRRKFYIVATYLAPS
jgi:hypothetical protein